MEQTLSEKYISTIKSKTKYVSLMEKADEFVQTVAPTVETEAFQVWAKNQTLVLNLSFVALSINGTKQVFRLNLPVDLTQYETVLFLKVVAAKLTDLIGSPVNPDGWTYIAPPYPFDSEIDWI